MYYLQETLFKSNKQIKVDEWKQLYQANSVHKTADKTICQQFAIFIIKL